MRVLRATHIMLLVILVLIADSAETRQVDRRLAQGTLSNMEEHQDVQLGTASWQSVRASSFRNQLNQIRLQLKDTAALLSRQTLPPSAMKNLTPDQEKQANIDITPLRTLALAQQRTNDISNDVVSLVSQFQQEAQQNSNSENVRNLDELKTLQSQMKNALHAAGMKTSAEKMGSDNQGFSGQFERMGEAIGDLSAQSAPAPPAFVPQVTEVKSQQQMDESDVIHQIDEQISRLDKIQQAAGEPERSPRSKAVESSGATERLALQNQRSDFLSKESSFVNQSSAQSDGAVDQYGSRYDNIQEQLRLLQEMLPKIEDAGQRAGLLQQFAPKIEDQMNSLEQKIQNEEKSSESTERSPLPAASTKGSAKQAPQLQPISVPAAVPSRSPRRTKQQLPVNKLHQAGSKKRSKKTEDDERDDSDIDRKIEETKAKIEQAKEEGNSADAEDCDDDDTVIFSSRKANGRQTPSSSTEETAISQHDASSTTTGGSARASSAEEEQGAGSTAQSSNPIESSIQDALKIKKDEMHHKKDKNFVESSIQQALRIKELEAKIARLEEKQKSNAQIISQQNMMQQLVMPSIISLSQRVMDMEKSKGGDNAAASADKISIGNGLQQLQVSSAKPNLMQRANGEEKCDQDDAPASNEIADKLESLNEGLQRIVHARGGDGQKKKRKDKKKLQQKDGGAASAESAKADQAKIAKVMDLVDRIKKLVKGEQGGDDAASGATETSTQSSSSSSSDSPEIEKAQATATEQSSSRTADASAQEDFLPQSAEFMSSKQGKQMDKRNYQQKVQKEIDLADNQSVTQNEFVKSLPIKEFEI